MRLAVNLLLVIRDDSKRDKKTGIRSGCRKYLFLKCIVVIERLITKMVQKEKKASSSYNKFSTLKFTMSLISMPFHRHNRLYMIGT